MILDILIWMRSVAATLSDVEIIVNNAGIGRPATPLTATHDDQQLLYPGIGAQFYAARSAAAH